MLLMLTYANFITGWPRLKPVGVSGDTIKVVEDWKDESTAWRFIGISEQGEKLD